MDQKRVRIMVKFEIRGQEENEEETVILWLEKSNNGTIYLRAGIKGKDNCRPIIILHPNKDLSILKGKCSELGFTVYP